jgi:hypothetical protein
MIIVYSETHTKNIHKMKSLTVEAAGEYSYHWAFKGETSTKSNLIYFVLMSFITRSLQLQ